MQRRSLSIKRSRSKFISPFLSKRQKTSDDGLLAQRLAFTNDVPEGSEDAGKRQLLIKELKEKEEKLRRLKMVQLYKSKVCVYACE